MASTDYNQCAEEFLQTNPEEGLSSEEAQRRLQKFGVNAPLRRRRILHGS